MGNIEGVDLRSKRSILVGVTVTALLANKVLDLSGNSVSDLYVRTGAPELVNRLLGKPAVAEPPTIQPLPAPEIVQPASPIQCDPIMKVESRSVEDLTKIMKEVFNTYTKQKLDNVSAKDIETVTKSMDASIRYLSAALQCRNLEVELQLRDLINVSTHFKTTADGLDPSTKKALLKSLISSLETLSPSISTQIKAQVISVVIGGFENAKRSDPQEAESIVTKFLDSEARSPEKTTGTSVLFDEANPLGIKSEKSGN